MTGSDSALLQTREAIFATPDITTERVEVPEWGGAVLVKAGTGEDRDEFEKALTIKRRGEGGKIIYDSRRDQIREEAAWRCIVNDQGERVLTQQDIPALRKRSASALDRVFTVFCKLWGITEKDVAELEDEEKNS
jgi:hypothetical protein